LPVEVAAAQVGILEVAFSLGIAVQDFVGVHRRAGEVGDFAIEIT
jgi:hypothetical protein